MKKFQMTDVEQIEQMLAEGKTVSIEWKEYGRSKSNIGIVKWVRWDGLVFTTSDCVYTGLDRLVRMEAVA